MPERPLRLTPITSLAGITVTGGDAASFLGAQLSQAPPEGRDEARLAAWHDAKGRVQALFRVIQYDGAYLLVTHASAVDEVTASLRRYILRADVALDAARELKFAALLGKSASWLGEQGIDLGPETGAVARARETTWLRLGPQLIQALGAPTAIERLGAQLPGGPEDDAELAEIRLGLPVVSAELRGQFLPQMLNLDVLGGIAFDKGCYPGQEIIARAQNLGTVKRRMLHFSGDLQAIPSVGSDLLDNAGRPAGVIIRAARAQRGIELLAVVRLETYAEGLVCADSGEAALRAEPLPYAIAGMEPRTQTT